MTPVIAVFAGVLLLLAGCAGSGPRSGTTLCEAAGGSYAGGTCTRSDPNRQAAERMCDASGGVYLAGQDQCAIGMGGP
jgi:hypothetical protein